MSFYSRLYQNVAYMFLLDEAVMIAPVRLTVPPATDELSMTQVWNPVLDVRLMRQPDTRSS